MIDNTSGEQTIEILIKVSPQDPWEHWAVSGLYVLENETSKATNFGGEKLPAYGTEKSLYGDITKKDTNETR